MKPRSRDAMHEDKKGQWRISCSRSKCRRDERTSRLNVTGKEIGVCVCACLDTDCPSNRAIWFLSVADHEFEARSSFFAFADEGIIGPDAFRDVAVGEDEAFVAAGVPPPSDT